MSKDEVSALYFPYTKCFNKLSLKRALLYFDKVHFIDPFSLDEQQNLLTTSHYYNGVSLDDRDHFQEVVREVYYFLEDQGVIYSENILPLIKEYGRELTANSLDDISDDVFCSYSYGDIDINVEKVTWHILEQRMPPQMLEVLENVSWSKFRKEIAQSAVIYTDIDSAAKYLSFESEFYKYLPKRKQLRKNGQFTRTYVVAKDAPYTSRGSWGNDPDFDKAFLSTGYIVPYALGASISITQSMLYAARNNLALFTDSDTMYYLLARKCQRAMQRANRTIAEIRLYDELLRKLKENDIAIAAIDSVISPTALDALDFVQILQLRKAYAPQLQEFRSYLSGLGILKTMPWETGYYDELRQRTIDLKREIKLLQDGLVKTFNKIFRSSLQATLGVGLGIAIMPHSVTFGTALALLAAKDIPLAPLFELWNASIEKRNHSLSYLINMETKAKRAERHSEKYKPWNRAEGKYKFGD